MLQRLGRWLRAAGYDTVIAEAGEADSELLNRAIKEERLLITRDRGIAALRRARGRVILLDCNSLEACARELSEKIDIDWQLQPFTRCMSCNTHLHPAKPQERAALPLSKKSYVDAAYFCPECQKLYWDGSHVQRMREHLEAWHNRFSHLPVRINHS